MKALWVAEVLAVSSYVISLMITRWNQRLRYSRVSGGVLHVWNNDAMGIYKGRGIVRPCLRGCLVRFTLWCRSSSRLQAWRKRSVTRLTLQRPFM